MQITLRSDGVVLDERGARVGLREVELVREPDDAGESFFSRVNGVAIFAKGANWIPDDPFPSRTTRERCRTLVELARDCGMNMLRVWGGGLYESTDFYDACDELGILVWQDFPYACAFYPEDDTTAGAAAGEVATRFVDFATTPPSRATAATTTDPRPYEGSSQSVPAALSRTSTPSFTSASRTASASA